MYSNKIFIELNSFISGSYKGVCDIGEDCVPIPWDAPLIKCFMEDDDLQEMSFCSTNIGFSKRLQKIRDGADISGFTDYSNQPTQEREDV